MGSHYKRHIKNNQKANNKDETILLIETKKKRKQLEEKIRNKNKTKTYNNNKNENEENLDKCDYCKRYGHKTEICHYKRTNDKSIFKCEYCDLPWHTVDKCLKKQKDRNEGTITKTIKKEEDAIMTLIQEDENNIDLKNQWILDSGATQHVTNNYASLFDKTKTDLNIGFGNRNTE